MVYYRKSKILYIGCNRSSPLMCIAWTCARMITLSLPLASEVSSTVDIAWICRGGGFESGQTLKVWSSLPQDLQFILVTCHFDAVDENTLLDDPFFLGWEGFYLSAPCTKTGALSSCLTGAGNVKEVGVCGECARASEQLLRRERHWSGDFRLRSLPKPYWLDRSVLRAPNCCLLAPYWRAQKFIATQFDCCQVLRIGGIRGILDKPGSSLLFNLVIKKCLGDPNSTKYALGFISLNASTEFLIILVIVDSIVLVVCE